MKDFLMNNKIYAEYLGIIAGVITLLVTARKVHLAAKNIDTTNNHLKVNNYRALNLRYANLLAEVAEVQEEMGKQKNFMDLSAKSKLWVRRYFDLTSEEFWLYHQNLIHEEMWERGIICGIRMNMKEYPALKAGLLFWGKQDGYSHLSGFVEIIEKL